MLFNVNQLKIFSLRHKGYLAAIFQEIQNHYGNNLLALAVFGSYARFENRKNSDLDILIVLQQAPRRTERLDEFVKHIEMKHEQTAQDLYEREGVLCELSPFILTSEEVFTFHPIYCDMTEYCIILVDPKDIVKNVILSMETLLKQMNAKKVRRNNTWEWQLDQFLGGMKL